MMKAAEGQVEPAQVQQGRLEYREGDRGSQLRRVRRGFSVDDDEQDGGQCDGQLQDQPKPSRYAGRGLFGDLGVVVGEAEQAIARRDHDDGPDIDIAEVGPQQGADQKSRQDHHAAHGGRAGFFDHMALNAFLADGLPLALLGLHPADEARPHGHDNQLGGEQRHTRPESQVFHQVEDRNVPAG